jgi:hypothetical protein
VGKAFNNRNCVLVEYSKQYSQSAPAHEIKEFLPSNKIKRHPHSSDNTSSFAVVLPSPSHAEEHGSLLMAHALRANGSPFGFMPAVDHYDIRPEVSANLTFKDVDLVDGIGFMKKAFGANIHMIPVGHNGIHLAPLGSKWTRTTLLDKLKQLQNMCKRQCQTHLLYGVTIGDTYHPFYIEPPPRQSPSHSHFEAYSGSAGHGYGFLQGPRPGIDLDLLGTILKDFTGLAMEARPRTAWIEDPEGNHFLRFDCHDMSALAKNRGESPYGSQVQAVPAPAKFVVLFDPFATTAAPVRSAAADLHAHKAYKAPTTRYTDLLDSQGQPKDGFQKQKRRTGHRKPQAAIRKILSRPQTPEKVPAVNGDSQDEEMSDSDNSASSSGCASSGSSDSGDDSQDNSSRKNAKSPRQ